MAPLLTIFINKIQIDNSVKNSINPGIINWGDIIVWFAILGLILAIIVFFLSNKKSERILNFISNNLLPISLIVWLLGVFIYIIGFYRPDINCFPVILRSIMSAFKMFLVIQDLARIQADLLNDTLYMSTFSLIHFIAAFITFLFVFKMIGYKIKSSLNIIIHKLFYAKEKNIHLFWGVNEASCLLAEDIRKNFPDETIIFIDIDDADDNSKQKATLTNITNSITITNREITRLDSINALVDHCYNGPASINSEMDIFGVLKLNNIGKIIQISNKANFYFLSDNEARNISGALNLQRDKSINSMKNNNSIIYVHARRDANNEVFNHYSQYDENSNRIKIKIIDSAYLSICTLKQDSKFLPVNCVKIDKESGLVETPFTALIVGFGGTGIEAFKFLYEYSAFVGKDLKKSKFRCYAVDEKMNKIAGIIKEEMPSIKEEELSLIQASIDSKEFWEKINEIIKDLNYVVIALNNDVIGLSLAVNLFKCAIKNCNSNDTMLKIMVRCYDNNNEQRMSEVINNLNKSIADNIEIVLYGKSKDLYCCKNILSDLTLREAKEFNKIYENSDLTADEQWSKNFSNREINRLMTNKKMSRYHAIYDINRRISQNISNSLHSSTKMILMGVTGDGYSERIIEYYDYVNSRENNTTIYKCEDKHAQLLKNMAMVEHERWIASHKLMGYSYNSKNSHEKKYHRCMCHWDNLDEITKSYDCNVIDTTIKMAYKKLNNETI